MSSEASGNVYEELGVKPVINAAGQMTLLGGSVLSPKVIRAMEEANRSYVDMKALQDRSGQIIAELLGAEAAYVTPGCCAALALGTSACMTGSDPGRIERVPDVTGMRHQVIIQGALRYAYDRCLTVPGAKLVQVGDATGSDLAQIEEAIGDRTAAIAYLAPSRGDGVVPLEEIICLGKQRGVPIIVDAAAQVYPVENLGKYTAMGADLVCYGAKYFGAPNSSGILSGRKDLVEAAALQSFIGFESNPFRGIGRPMKLDRQEIIAVVVALREWMAMDHRARFDIYERCVKSLREKLAGVPHIEMAPQGSPVSGLRIGLDEKALGKTATEIARALREGEPSIWVRAQGEAITLSAAPMRDDDVPVIADRLQQVLAE